MIATGSRLRILVSRTSKTYPSSSSSSLCVFSTEAAATKSNKDPVPIVWTTHLLKKEQVDKVHDIFHRLLWLDMFEVSMLNDYINERLGVPVMTPRQRNAMINQVEALDLDDAVGGVSNQGDGEEKQVEEVAAPKTMDIKLMGFDAAAKIKVIKEVRSIAGLGLKEAKEMVESAPTIIMKGLKPEQAKELQDKLEAAGAQITLQE